MKALQLSGRRFGRLTAVEEAGSKNGCKVWRCLCDCGRESLVRSIALSGGAIRSCGCIRAEREHGLSQSAEYKTWRSMRDRCERSSHISYEWYGALGVAVCERWHTFQNFYADMGPKPTPQHSIDRLDSGKGYEPGNCRWATATEQNRNKGDTVRLTINGRTQSAAEWARECGLSPSTVARRFRNGWAPEACISPAIHPRTRAAIRKEMA